MGKFSIFVGGLDTFSTHYESSSCRYCEEYVLQVLRCFFVSTSFYLSKFAEKEDRRSFFRPEEIDILKQLGLNISGSLLWLRLISCCWRIRRADTKLL